MGLSNKFSQNVNDTYRHSEVSKKTSFSLKENEQIFVDKLRKKLSTLNWSIIPVSEADTGSRR